jgi:N-acetylglucosamine-6-phosphate deacetylase
VFLVSDAMATVGSEIESFTLNGRAVLRKAGRLTLKDGTLAGADLELPRAVGVMIKDVGEDPSRAIARATSVPLSLLRNTKGLGGFGQGADRALYFKEGLTGRPEILKR